MKLIELHILQSFPVSCLNRDDVGAPKSAIFGGVNRSRISSQCLKRASREYNQANFPTGRFNGQRTRYIILPLQQALKKYGVDIDNAQKYALELADSLAPLDKVKEGEEPRIKTLMFLSSREIDSLAEEAAKLILISKDAKKLSNDIKKPKKHCFVSDAADIAIFGRMVASDASLTLEGAAMMSHALSTHHVNNDIDFFTAVDDSKLQVKDAGAAMMGVLEFVSAVYYRYVALNLDLLFDQNHLESLSQNERILVVEAFIRSSLMSVPNARKNSMNAHTLPGYVLGIVKDAGQPIQLINAFEEPVNARNGLMSASIERLKAHNVKLKNTWNIATNIEIAMPENNMNVFCSEILKYV